MRHYDLVIIGSGPGGFEVAIKARHAGLSVALIEKHEIGGTCLNYGCIPTKTLYQSAKVYQEVQHASQFGIEITGSHFDFSKMMERKDEVVQYLKQNIVTMLTKSGVDIHTGVARFIEKDKVMVSDETTIEFNNCIIATGSKEIIIPIKGAKLDNVLTSTDMMSLTELPKELVIIGGGVIGCEMASIYNSLGTHVVIVEALDKLLNNFDKDVSNRMKSIMKKQGIDIQLNTKVHEIDKNGDRLVVKCLNKKDQEVTFDATHVLMSVGRRAFTDQLNLEAVGIEYDRTGIQVNDQFQTNIKGIYAVGDCTGGKMLAHTATFQSFVALDDILNRTNPTNFEVTPACVFTFPEVASVGLTEEEANERYTEVKVKKSLFRANGKANAMGSVEGFIKVISYNNQLVGTHIVGEGASTIIHEASIMMDQKMDIRDSIYSIHAHPTLSEVLVESLRSLVE